MKKRAYRRPWPEAGTVRLLVLSLFCGLLIAGCGNSAQSKFEGKLDELFDSLIEDLEAYAAGDTSEEKAGTATWFEDGQPMMNPDVSIPADRSMDIISAAKEIQDHFSYVSLEFLQQDPEDLDDWGESFRERYDARRAEVGVLLDQIKERYRSNPDDYLSFMFGSTLGLSRDDHLYFRQGNTGYYIDEMIDIDFDEWLAAVKEQMRKLQ